MKYTCSCKLCEEVNEWDVEEYDINDMITFSINSDALMIVYLCTDCVMKISDISNSSNIQRQINAINEILVGYQKGLQNVYDLFKKLTDEGFINEFNYKLNEFKNEFKKMKKDINDSEQFIKKGLKTIGTINNLYTLSKKNPQLIKKLANIVNLLNEEDEENEISS